MKETLGINIANVTNEQLVRNLPWWNLQTVRMRTLPSFLIAGVQKCGTSSLVQYLSSHPQLIAPRRKDAYYFNNITRYRKGVEFYRGFFCLKWQQQWISRRQGLPVYTFDGTPNYFGAPGAAKRINATLPDIKIILLFRDPVKRAYSNYNMALKFGFETLPFFEALQLEDERVNWFPNSEFYRGHHFVYQRMAYRRRGEYAAFLPEWMDIFGERLHIDFTENLDTHPRETYSKILRFLELEDHQPDFNKVNVGQYKSPIDEKSREFLVERHRPFNRELEKILNQPLPW